MSDYQRRPSTAAPVAAPPCSLLEACVKAGLDRGFQRCPTCPVRDLCQSDMRWLVRVPLLQ